MHAVSAGEMPGRMVIIAVPLSPRAKCGTWWEGKPREKPHSLHSSFDDDLDAGKLLEREGELEMVGVEEVSPKCPRIHISSAPTVW